MTTTTVDFDESIGSLRVMFPDHAEDILTNLFLNLDCSLEETVDCILKKEIIE